MDKRKQKIDYIKGVISGKREIFDKLDPETLVHLEGFQYENITTGEVKTISGGLNGRGEHAKVVYFDPNINQSNGGIYFFCQSIEAARVISKIQ